MNNHENEPRKDLNKNRLISFDFVPFIKSVDDELPPARVVVGTAVAAVNCIVQEIKIRRRFMFVRKERTRWFQISGDGFNQYISVENRSAENLIAAVLQPFCVPCLIPIAQTLDVVETTQTNLIVNTVQDVLLS